MADFKKALAALRNLLYAVFSSVKVSFDLVSRAKISLTLAEMAVLLNVVHLLAVILQENRINIDHETAKLPPFTWSTGFAQKGNLSAPLFSV